MMENLHKERMLFEHFEHSKKPNAKKSVLFAVFTKDDLDEDEIPSYLGKYIDSFMQEKWELWQKAKAQPVPEQLINEIQSWIAVKSNQAMELDGEEFVVGANELAEFIDQLVKGESGDQE